MGEKLHSWTCRSRFGGRYLLRNCRMKPMIASKLAARRRKYTSMRAGSAPRAANLPRPVQG
jgi:hypothetical protein